MEGKILGNRYELIEKIGGGGMANVYKAKCNLLNRYVAIKILKHEYVNDDEFLHRFRVEAQSVASLSHPNIVSVYDVGHEDTIHYIVMEYVDGSTLKEHIAKARKLEWREAVNMAIQICSAIEHAHRNHIIHRDIKPHNILLTRNGVAKVTDFGIARAVSTCTITMAGNTIGSVHYFSPEQARGGFIDEKSDLYSLGIVLYEMILGRIPFDGDSPIAVALKHIQTKAEEPIDIDSNVSIGVNSIIMNAIEKDQCKRYQTASQMLEDLYRVLKVPNHDFKIGDEEQGFSTKKLPVIPEGSKSTEIVLDIRNSKRNMKNKRTSRDSGENKSDRITLWLAIITSVVVMSAVVFVAFSVIMPSMGIFNQQSKNFVVDDYTGRNIDEVKDELLQKGIQVKDVTRKYSDSVAKDIIISQNKAKGEQIKLGGIYSFIQFEVSNGQKFVKVPDLSKMNSREAGVELTDVGLKSEVIEEYSEKIGLDLVIKTSPEADAEVKPGTVVTIYKSKGPEEKITIVPNLMGLTKAQAMQLISDTKLSIGKIYPEDAINVIDKIIKQEPAYNAQVKEKTPVNIYFDQEVVQVRTRSVKETLKLNEDNKFGDNDKIEVRIEATDYDTGKTLVLMNESKTKKDFPLNFFVDVPDKGKTKVKIYLNGSVYNEFTEDLSGGSGL